MSRLEKCSDIGTQSSYLLPKIQNGFKIGARDLDACVTLNLMGSSYLEIGSPNHQLCFQLIPKTFGSEPNLCLLDTKTGLCVNQPLSKGETYGLLNKPTDASIADYFIRFSSRAMFERY
jgi:hypothetical protein